MYVPFIATQEIQLASDTVQAIKSFLRSNVRKLLPENFTYVNLSVFMIIFISPGCLLNYWLRETV